MELKKIQNTENEGLSTALQLQQDKLCQGKEFGRRMHLTGFGSHCAALLGLTFSQGCGNLRYTAAGVRSSATGNNLDVYVRSRGMEVPHEFHAFRS